jgi:NADPH:quinone reductase-like Zn-dependent oxidoreductase
VEAVGKNATLFKPGQEVMGDICESWGGFAEYVCVNEKSLTLKPTDMPFGAAAAIPQAGTLALQSLSYTRPVNSGDKILINGAGGGVGTFAVQIAKSFGAEVTCVDSSEKLDLLRSIGADHVIDYKQEDFCNNGKRYNRIIDVVANRSVFNYKRSLLPNGILVLVGGSISAILRMVLLGPLLSMADNRKMGILVHKPNKDIAFINKLWADNKLTPVIDRTYPLSEVPLALQYLGKGGAKGKLVISVVAPPTT